MQAKFIRTSAKLDDSARLKVATNSVPVTSLQAFSLHRAVPEIVSGACANSCGSSPAQKYPAQNRLTLIRVANSRTPCDIRLQRERLGDDPEGTLSALPNRLESCF